jgi:hypothetical protein
MVAARLQCTSLLCSQLDRMRSPSSSFTGGQVSYAPHCSFCPFPILSSAFLEHGINTRAWHCNLGSFVEFLPMLTILSSRHTPDTLPYHVIVAFSSRLHPLHRSPTGPGFHHGGRWPAHSRVNDETRVQRRSCCSRRRRGLGPGYVHVSYLRAMQSCSR